VSSRYTRALDAIEPEIARTRARLGDTADALATELVPTRLADRGIEMINGLFHRRRPVRLGGLCADPLALALLGLGAGWLAAENAGLIDRLFPSRGEASAAATGGGGGPDKTTESGSGSTLLLGLAGLAAGAAAALLLPPSPRERAAAARLHEKFWNTAEELGHRTAASLRAATEAPARPPPKG
jgi:hypothetical protein